MPPASIPPFQQIKSIKVHTDSVNTIAFSADGKFLASGGDDAYIHIFETTTWKEWKKYKAVSPVHTIAWHPEGSKAITFGLKEGIIPTIQLKNDVKWEHSVPGRIHCMSFQANGQLLAVGFNNQVLVARQASMSTWSNERYLPNPPRVNIGTEDVTRSVHFHSKEKLLVVTYLYTGVRAFDTEDFGIMRWQIDTEHRCGDSALSPTSRLLVTTNLFNGLDWYDITNRRYTSTTPCLPASGTNVPLPVLFIETNIVTVGSAVGEVSIFKSGNAQALQVLNHNGEMVQALAHHYDINQKSHLLATGISEQFEECMLTIWTAQDKKPTLRLPQMRWMLYSCLAGISSILLFKNTSRIAEYNNRMITSGQQFSSNLWSYVSNATQATVTATYTHVITKTIDVEATTALPIEATRAAVSLVEVEETKAAH